MVTRKMDTRYYEPWNPTMAANRLPTLLADDSSWIPGILKLLGDDFACVDSVLATLDSFIRERNDKRQRSAIKRIRSFVCNGDMPCE